jgi:glycosyltransferase involved in cell wall biosynthesis
MASGLPVILTSHCGAADLITKDRGWVVQPGDVQGLSEALKSADAARDKLDTMGQAAARGVSKLGWGHYQQQVVAEVEMAFQKWQLDNEKRKFGE